LYFDAMRELRIRRKGMENVFHQEIANAFMRTAGNELNGGAAATAISFDTLSLVNEDELEDDLAIDGMAQRSRQRNEEALRFLARRFDALLPNSTIEADDLPVNPKIVCESLRVAGKTLALDMKAKLVVYKLFERAALAELPDIYAEANEFLAENGVLPDLHVRKPKAVQPSQRPTPPPRSAQTQNEMGENEITGPTPLDIRAEVFSAIRDLLAEQKGSMVNDAGLGAPTMPMVDTSQLMKALSAVQHDPNAVAGQQIDIRSALAHRLPVVIGRVDGGTIGSVNDDVIDIVSMLFDFILGDNNLADEIKAPLSRLQIPLIKVAVADKTFFSNRNHPARVLLNEMAFAGLGWDPERRGRDGLQGKIEHIVQRVLTEFEDDMSVFDTLLQEFRAFVEEERRRASILEKRTREAEEGKAKAETAKQAVDSIVARACKGKNLPGVVTRLINEVWSKVLLLERLRNGADSEIFREHQTTLENLIRSVTARTPAERAAMPSLLPPLVRKLRGGFEAISYGAIESTQIMQELESVHFALMRSTPEDIEQFNEDLLHQENDAPDLGALPSLQETDLLAESLPDVTEDDLALLNAHNIAAAAPAIEEIQLDAAPAPEVEDELLQQVDNLPVGSWIEIREDNAKAVRCKLAAKIPTIGKLIFVNRGGMKVAEYTRMGLAVALRRGSAALLDDAALFDRALEAVISNLRKLKSND
jgi:hypothetical protein